MTWISRVLLSVLLTATFTGVGGYLRAANNPPVNPSGEAQYSLTIRIYDYAGVSERILSQAQAEAAEIYQRIGVNTTWLRCTSDPDEMRNHPCNNVRGTQVLGLQLLPNSMEPKEGLPNGIFGFALLPPDGRPGSYAKIYSDNVSKLADGRVYRESAVLGHMLAHEIGHLLLGIGSHSRSGLMKIPWGPKELTLADRGGLSFSKKEIRRIAKNLELRAEKDEASD